LVAVDLDGTLLTSDGSLAPVGGQLLRKAARDGVQIILATTRNPDSVQPFCRELEINDPIICTNGAQIWGSPDGPIWARLFIPSDAALRIAQLADLHGWELSITVGSMTYWRRRPGQRIGRIAPNVAIVATNTEAVNGDPVRILVHQPDAIGPIQHICRTELSHQCHTESFYKFDGSLHSLGIFARGANKGAALAFVLERLGARRENALALGDNPTDVSMFAHARVSVAMGNAPAYVKREANVVAPSNDHEGVAWALKRFLV
jgi:Cof subfamily protein (haloacid dehalogenase superfamily)